MERSTDPLKQTLAQARTQSGENLEDLSSRQPVLVVFLRHGGCSFCREALADLHSARKEIEQTGTTIALVHMMRETDAKALLTRYALEDLPRIGDPARRLYGAFELHRGSLRELLGSKTWRRALVGGVLFRQGMGAIRGDGRQMPGVFLIHQGRILQSYRHRTVADRPDYRELCNVSRAAS